MTIENVDIEHSVIQMEDIWGMEDLFGEEAHDEPAKGFKLEVDNYEPKGIVFKFSRGADERDIMIEQQGDEIVLHFYPNQPEVEERIILSRDEVVTEPESNSHKGP